MRRALLLIFAIGLTSLTLATPTREPAKISLSNDGTHWGESLSRPLFEDSIRWVPGDVRTADFYVRSNSKLPTTLSVDLLAGGQPGALNSGDLQIEARVAESPWQATSAAGRVVADRPTSPGETTRVEIRVSFSGEAKRRTDLPALNLQFQISLAPTEGVIGSTMVPQTLLDLPSWRDLLAGFVILCCLYLAYSWAGWRKGESGSAKAVFRAN